MTSPLRRKRPTTASAPSTPAPTPARWAAAGLLLLAGGLAPAQEPAALPPLPAWQPSVPTDARPPLPVKKLSFHKPAAPALTAAQPEPGAIRPVQAFSASRLPAAVTGEQAGYEIQLLPPGFERLTRIQSEDSLREQLRQEGREKSPPERAIFPDEPPVTDEPYARRTFPGQVALVEPHYLNYKRLYFEDLNTERYAWELGPVQPFASAGRFFADVALLPYRFASRPLDCVESSAGYCLPGDSVPYLLYPPNVSTTGALGEAAVVLGLIAIFP
jgi:hypothetical protein